jgi:SRSO17 transposase
MISPCLCAKNWQLEDAEAVLGSDDTGLLKQGRHSAGVARQDSGTAGRVENCQSGVFRGDASRLGHTLLDRELSLPQEWMNDRDRCRQAGIPAAQRCATKPQRARQMLARACSAGVPATWGTGERVDGHDRRLRMGLEGQPHASGLAVSGQEAVWRDWRQQRVNTLVAGLPASGWTRLSADEGAKGPRWDDWRWLSWADPVHPAWRRWRLVRRRVSTPQERPASGVFAPHDTTWEAVVRGAGARWTMEPLLETAQGEVGLDHYEVRSWTGWYRHMTLALWALALLTVWRAGAVAVEACKKRRAPGDERSPLAAFKARRGRGSP